MFMINRDYVYHTTIIEPPTNFTKTIRLYKDSDVIGRCAKYARNNNSYYFGVSYDEDCLLYPNPNNNDLINSIYPSNAKEIAVYKLLKSIIIDKKLLNRPIKIAINYNNKYYFLMHDNMTGKNELLQDMYSLYLDDNKGALFYITQVGKNKFIIKKNINGKECRLIFSRDGVNIGFSIYNAVLTYNKDYFIYDKMSFKKYNNNNYKIYPFKRNRCYLTIAKYTLPLTPIFECYSTALSAYHIGSFVKFIPS